MCEIVLTGSSSPKAFISGCSLLGFSQVWGIMPATIISVLVPIGKLEASRAYECACMCTHYTHMDFAFGCFLSPSSGGLFSLCMHVCMHACAHAGIRGREKCISCIWQNSAVKSSSRFTTLIVLHIDCCKLHNFLFLSTRYGSFCHDCRHCVRLACDFFVLHATQFAPKHPCLGKFIDAHGTRFMHRSTNLCPCMEFVRSCYIASSRKRTYRSSRRCRGGSHEACPSSCPA
jgi:hypothetical protein